MIIFDGLRFGEGWRADLAVTEVPRIVEADSLRRLSDYFAATSTGKPRDKVDLTVYLKEVWGDRWYLNQGDCGSCVAFGAALACDVLTAIDIVENRRRKPNGRTDPMSIYWGSRVEIGGGRLWGEGSVGVWAAKYLKEFGALEQKKYDAVDLTIYSPSVCCGSNSRRGVPDAIEPIARQHPVKAYAQVKTFEEAVTSLDAGYPVTIASNQGFRMQLDANGFATASGTWNHQMCVVGFELVPVPCLYIANSWGACYSGGPPGWNPAVKKVKQATANRMLGQNDSWVLSDFESFAPKTLDLSRLRFI